MVKFVWLKSHVRVINPNKPIQMPSLFPFFNCCECDSRVQAVVPLKKGSIPLRVVSDSRTKLSAEFEDGDFTRYCRGQGNRYRNKENANAPYMTHMKLSHFNFSGSLNKLCCFCALTTGYSLTLFENNACLKCAQKEALRAEFAKLYKMPPSSSLWAALPSAVLDKIMRNFLGEKLCIVEGSVIARRKCEWAFTDAHKS